ncbi:MAG: MBL fold metallo-hydrolase [Anaerolineae bacterium]
MRRERVSDDIYVFTSSLYVQVTASAVVTPEGIVVVDTLPFPAETVSMLEYLSGLGRGPIRYLVNTHWHGDHSYGNYLFDDTVQLVCHKLCQAALLEDGAVALEEDKAVNPELEEVILRVPDIIFEDGDMVIHLGEKSIELRLMAGHTHDSTVAYVREDKVLLAADTMMPVPHFVGGSRQAFIASLHRLKDYNLESIVQGHGEVLLRGEIPEAIDSSIRYLEAVYDHVKAVVDAGHGPEALSKITIEKCGKSRIPLNGLVQDLHKANVYALYQQLRNGVRSDLEG